MADGLTSILSSLATLELAPDADPEFLGNLRSMLTSKWRETQASQLGDQAAAMSPSSPTPAGVGLDGNIAVGGDPAGMAGPPGLDLPGMGGPPPGPMDGMPGSAGPMGGPMPGAMGAGAPGPGRGFSPRPAPPDIDGLRRLLNPG